MELNSFPVLSVLLWYDRNRRPLPWRQDRDPYHIWISEIMLQQTRIETVIPYYRRFLDALPDISSLAAVSGDELMKLWQGLGYYSRAKNLKKAAEIIMKEYGGSFPSSFEEIGSLPGIGPYTAGAIASICFDEKTPAIDGNVLRVFGRFLEEERNTADPSFRRDLHDALLRIYPKEAGDFTGALMEIGEMLCLPNTLPLCEDCPLKENCLSRRDNKTMEYPKMPRKKRPKKEKRTVFLLVHDGKTAVRKREERGLLSGLYEFPNTEGHKGKREIMDLFKDLEPSSIEKAEGYSHQFSHILWENEVWLIRCKKEMDYEWIDRKTLEEKTAIPAAFKKSLDILKEKL